jgi:uncharacterized membrane protein YbhN (UPF0104 family)
MLPRALRSWPGWPRLWARIKTGAPWALALVVVVLLVRHARTVAWLEVWAAVRDQPPLGFATASALAVLSYALFSSYDLVGRHETRHAVSAPRTLSIAAVSYAFNLNLGALVGALALKLGLYERAGLKAVTVAHIIALSILTNWLGYLTLGGLLLVFAPPPLPAQFHLSDGALLAFGAALLALSAAYVAMCFVRQQRAIAVRGRRLTPPAGRIALWQLAVSVANWAVIGLIIWVLLQRQLPYPTVLGVLLLAAVAGVVTHVPAGLGVIEAVFVACLGSQVPQGTLLAALLTYRAVYYLGPLVLAALTYGVGEAAARSSAGTSRPPRHAVPGKAARPPSAPGSRG